MTTIATNLRNTLDSARRTRFDPVGLVTATNVQDAIQQVGVTNILVPTIYTGSASLTLTDVLVESNAGAPATYLVPNSISWATQNGTYARPLSIYDISGNASTNNITLTFTAGQLADGQASLTITTDYGGVQLMPQNGGGWIVL